MQVGFHQGGQHADAVDEHMDADGVAQTVGQQYDGGKDCAQHKGVQRLVQVPVEQPKSRPADEDGGAVTEDTHPIQQQSAENELLCYGATTTKVKMAVTGGRADSMADTALPEDCPTNPSRTWMSAKVT